ncbi:MAG TPA: MOSC domain-containing protein [Nocardioides sp.]|nr:MOSC domain-containing protein [Nocardioides sp.]
MSVRVESIHVAKGSRLPMQEETSVEVETGKGIVGDRYHGTRHRRVTVQSRESLDEAAAALGAAVPTELTRRNLTISGAAVPRDPGARLRIGEALRRRAGTVFRVLEGGTVTVGDPVAFGEPNGRQAPGSTT